MPKVPRTARQARRREARLNAKEGLALPGRMGVTIDLPPHPVLTRRAFKAGFVAVGRDDIDLIRDLLRKALHHMGYSAEQVQPVVIAEVINTYAPELRRLAASAIIHGQGLGFERVNAKDRPEGVEGVEGVGGDRGESETPLMLPSLVKRYDSIVEAGAAEPGAKPSSGLVLPGQKAFEMPQGKGLVAP